VQEFAIVSMTNATVLKHVEDTVSTYSEEQQLDEAMREKIAKYGLLPLSFDLHSSRSAQHIPAALLACPAELRHVLLSCATPLQAVRIP